MFKICVKFLISFLLFANFLLANEKVYRLSLASSYENSSPIVHEAVMELVKKVQDLSGGRLIIRVDTPAKHKSSFGIYDFVKLKKYDMGFTCSYFYKGKNSVFSLFTTMPFGMTKDEFYSWWYYGNGKELAQEIYSTYNIKPFLFLNSGMQMGGWFKKEIKSLEDLKGLKIRIPGFGGEIFSNLGATITTLPIGELYMALEMGTIDAVEWVSPAFDKSFGFDKVANYYYTGWQEPASDNQIIINLDVYNSLPKDLQEILSSAIAQVGEYFYAKILDQNAKVIYDMQKNQPNLKILSFPDDVMKQMKNINLDILKKESDSNQDFKRVYESQMNYLNHIRKWTMMGDYAYLNKMKDEK